jgi:hypothetical protein
LNKTNVIKFNIEVLSKCTLKEILLLAISSFNESNDNCKIHNKTEKYKIKLSKKSGLPDMDLPGK